MTEFVPTVAMATLVIAVINFLRYLSAGKAGLNGVVTQLIAWVAGVVVTLLFAQTDFASGIAVGDLPLDQLNFWSVVVVGLTVASAGSFLVELRKAFDPSDSSVKPRLLGGTVTKTKA